MHGPGYVRIGDVRYWFHKDGSPPMIPDPPLWDDQGWAQAVVWAQDKRGLPLALVKPRAHVPMDLWFRGVWFRMVKLDSYSGLWMYRQAVEGVELRMTRPLSSSELASAVAA